MKELRSPWSTRIQSRLQEVIERVGSTSRFPLDAQQLNYLSKLAVKGKQFRGILLLDLYERLSGKQASDGVLDIAVAVELYGTALLIHDDIMDRADQRRSLPTAHTYFAQWGESEQLQSADHFGVGVALCLGDVAFFLADKLLAEAAVEPEVRLKLASISADELALLGLAQVEDLRLSSSNQPVTKDQIISMYSGKTGRYTGRWPVVLAATLAGLSDDLCEQLGAIGEQIGTVYQLKDDELGIFGAEVTTGKSSTSDITEGKKTLYYYYLEQELADVEKEKIFSIIGNPQASDGEITTVKDTILQSGIAEKVNDEILKMKGTIDTEIASISIPQAAQQYLLGILEFVVTREK